MRKLLGQTRKYFTLSGKFFLAQQLTFSAGVKSRKFQMEQRCMIGTIQGKKGEG